MKSTEFGDYLHSIVQQVVCQFGQFSLIAGTKVYFTLPRIGENEAIRHFSLIAGTDRAFLPSRAPKLAIKSACFRGSDRVKV